MMLRNAILVGLLCLSVAACGKKDEGANASGGATGTNVTPAVDCEKVVEKIASLNPPDFRGEPEKKLWRSMCGQMKPEERTCVMGAKAMDDMKKCMKN